MKNEIGLPAVIAAIVLLVIVVGIMGYMHLRTPGPTTPPNKLPVPVNPYKRNTPVMPPQ